MYRIFNAKVYFDEEVLSLFPGLSVLTDQQKEMIVLAEGYSSPYYRFPTNERWQKAKRKVYGKDDVSTEGLENAIEIIKSGNFDSKRETVRVFVDKIQQLQNKIISEENPKEISLIDVAIERLQKRIDKLQSEITASEQVQVSLKADGKLSFLENWQNNMKKKKQDDRDKGERTGIAVID